jgi:hypothetical protein
VAQTGLPELDVARVRRWCDQRVPAHLRDQIRVECDLAPRHLTIVECRPPWREDAGADWTRFPIARLRYTKATGRWSLYWRDRNLHFHLYDTLTRSCRKSTAIPPASSGDRKPQRRADGFPAATAVIVTDGRRMARPRPPRAR